MKKSLFLIVLSSFFLASGIFAQKGSLIMTFKATDYYSHDTLIMDSVYVENTARNCDTTIYGPHPRLLLTWVTGIDELLNTNGIQVAQNYPNPFAGSTKCTIKLTDKKDITVALTNVYGKQLAVLQKTLNSGTHTFDVETGASGIYFLTVSHGKVSKTLKLTCRDGSAQNNFHIRYSGNDDRTEGFKAAPRDRGFTFLPGDMLNMTAYAFGHENNTYGAAPVEDYTAYFNLKPNYVSFHADSTWGYVPIHATFTVQTNIPNLTSWHWDFGDGESSELENPTHTYTTPGTYYTVTLTAQGDDGSYVAEKVNYIHTLNEVAGVDFVADITDGMAPMMVHFVAETSVPNPTNWQWGFGDGTGAQHVQNPYHEYTYPGVYTVNVTVYDNNGQTSETKEDYIYVNYCPSTVTDADGNVYNTVAIGSQCWMKENLNVGTKISGWDDAGDNGIIEKFCYGGSESYCNEYGGLYQFYEYMQYDYTEGTQGICPDGWHIPDDADFEKLSSFSYAIEGSSGGSLKEPGFNHWHQPNTGATNSTRFTAYGAGYLEKRAMYHYHPYYTNIGADAYFGSSTSINSDLFLAWDLWFAHDYFRDYNVEKLFGVSIRCLKNQEDK